MTCRITAAYKQLTGDVDSGLVTQLTNQRFLKQGNNIMRIYAVADIHGKRERLQMLRHNIRQYQPELLVVAGDITNYRKPAPIIRALNDLPVPVLAVRGNSDLPVVEQLLRKGSNVFSLHQGGYRTGRFSFSGISGCLMLPFRTRIGLNETNRLHRLETDTAHASVWVLHPPPFGSRDRILGKVHSGSKAAARIIAARQPLLVLCGHIHEDVGRSEIGKSIVVNCSIGKNGEGVLLMLGHGAVEDVHFL